MYLPCCVDDDVLEGFDFFYCRSTLKSAFYFSRVFLNLCLNFFQLVRLSLVLGLPAMESLLGITAKDCVILAADSTTAHSISVMKHGESMVYTLLQLMLKNFNADQHFAIPYNFSLILQTKPKCFSLVRTWLWWCVAKLVTLLSSVIS